MYLVIYKKSSRGKWYARDMFYDTRADAESHARVMIGVAVAAVVYVDIESAVDTHGTITFV